MIRRTRAEILNSRASKLQEGGQLQEAIKLYYRAAVVDPAWAAPLFNLGLLYKKEHRWKESLKYNRLATKRDVTHEAAWWNLGIAATALGRWKLARVAWRAYGIDLPEGEGPIDFPCGFGPIRLNPEADAEVVWAYRIDPARAEIASIPFPESNHRWRDVVLNDGAPVGYRQHQGQEVPVLNELELLERSPFATFVAEVCMPDRAEYVKNLAELAADLGGCAEDWSTSVRMICKACSEGRPHEKHDAEADRSDGVHLIGIAAGNLKHAQTILSSWKKEAEDIQIESLELALGAGEQM
jgi:tetratricopeptide (TPR) repeat protein